MELGLDVNLKSIREQPLPWISFLYTINQGWLAPGALEVTPYWGTYNRSVVLGGGRLPIDAKLGACWDGTPHVEVGIGSVPVMVAAALVMLVAGKPINVTRKEVGGWRLNLGLPRTQPLGKPYTLEPAIELDAGVQRCGRALVLSLGQLSPVLRVVQ